MAEGLGSWLRRARESRELTLEDVEKSLRIRSRYLQALEMGDYAALPGEIQARGFLRNYAHLLGLSVDEALARYEAEVGGHPFQPHVRPMQDERAQQILDRPTVFAPPPTGDEEEKPQTGFSNGLLLALIGAAAIFALIALGSFIYLQFFLPTPEKPVATPELTPVETPIAMETQVTIEGESAFVPAVDGTVTVRLEPSEHAWARLIADDVIIFQGVAEPGQSLQATASNRCLVETGNGGAFKLFINNGDWGTLGAAGRAVRRAWSPAGEVAVDGNE